MSQGAVFLDRDDTIIADAHFLSRPEQVTLIPGAAAAIARLNAARIPVVLVTNQSGIARGLLTHQDYDSVQEALISQLAAHGARFSAAYMCPHHPDFTGPCECRKPGTLLFRRAADDLGLDLARSWYVGDRLRDAQPATALGATGRGILIPAPSTPRAELDAARAEFEVLATLDDAVRRIVESSG